MSRIFVSYRRADEKLAEEIKGELIKYGHEALLDADKVVGGSNWRDQIVSALKESDGLVALFTENTLQKPDYIASEIGMVRAFRETVKDMFIIPIRFGNIAIPNFIEDLLVAPISFSAMVIALILAGTVRGLINGVMILALGVLLIDPCATFLIFQFKL